MCAIVSHIVDVFALLLQSQNKSRVALRNLAPTLPTRRVRPFSVLLAATCAPAFTLAARRSPKVSSPADFSSQNRVRYRFLGKASLQTPAPLPPQVKETLPHRTRVVRLRCVKLNYIILWYTSTQRAIISYVKL